MLHSLKQWQYLPTWSMEWLQKWYTGYYCNYKPLAVTDWPYTHTQEALGHMYSLKHVWVGACKKIRPTLPWNEAYINKRAPFSVLWDRLTHTKKKKSKDEERRSPDETNEGNVGKGDKGGYIAPTLHSFFTLSTYFGFLFLDVYPRFQHICWPCNSNVRHNSHLTERILTACLFSHCIKMDRFYLYAAISSIRMHNALCHI